MIGLDGVAPSWMVGVSASVIHHKSPEDFLLASVVPEKWP